MNTDLTIFQFLGIKFDPNNPEASYAYLSYKLEQLEQGQGQEQEQGQPPTQQLQPVEQGDEGSGRGR